MSMWRAFFFAMTVFTAGQIAEKIGGNVPVIASAIVGGSVAILHSMRFFGKSN